MTIRIVCMVIWAFAGIFILSGCSPPGGECDDTVNAEEDSPRKVIEISAGPAAMDEIFALVPGDEFKALLFVKPAETLGSRFVERVINQEPDFRAALAALKMMAEEKGISPDQYRTYMLFAKNLQFEDRLEYHSAPLTEAGFKKFVVETLKWEQLEGGELAEFNYWRGKVNSVDRAFVSAESGVLAGREETIRSIIENVDDNTDALANNPGFAPARELLDPTATAGLLVWEGLHDFVESIKKSSMAEEHPLLKKFLQPLEDAQGAALLFYLEDDFELKLRLLFANTDSAAQFERILNGLVAVGTLIAGNEKIKEQVGEQEELLVAFSEILDSVYINREARIVEAGLSIPADSGAVKILVNQAIPMLDEFLQRGQPVEAADKK